MLSAASDANIAPAARAAEPYRRQVMAINGRSFRVGFHHNGDHW